MHSPKIKYTTAVLLNFKPKEYRAKMDTDICNHIKNFKKNEISEGKEEGQKYAQEFGTIIVESTITYCGH